MKFRLKLKLRTILISSFILLGLMIIAAYSLLTKEYFIRGLDASLAVSMEKTVKTFEEHVRQENQDTGEEFSGFNISSNWEHMPDYIRNAFKKPPEKHAVLYKEMDEPWFGRPNEILFLMKYKYKDKTYYISHRIVPEGRFKTLHVTHQQNKKLMLIINIAMIGLIIIICWLVLRRVSKPIKALKDWIYSLDSKKLAGDVPDFTYPELNELAELMKTSLSSVQQALDREHRFLRYASHELRTPISTIRTNIGLYRKLAEKNNQNPQEISALDRIDRASMTMKHLTETLLWMSHETETPLVSREIDIAELIDDLAEEMKYLLHGKTVTVTLKNSSSKQILPIVPARIVIGNLIRNAYQHSWQGNVLIEHEQGSIRISNDIYEITDTTSQNDQTGYGLGLELTAQLVQRLGWSAEHSIVDNRFIAELKV